MSFASGIERPPGLSAVHHGEDGIALERSADEHRVGELLGWRMLGEERRELDRRRPVYDEPDVASAADRAREQHGVAIELAELGLRDEDHRRGVEIGGAGAERGEQARGEYEAIVTKAHGMSPASARCRRYSRREPVTVLAPL